MLLRVLAFALVVCLLGVPAGVALAQQPPITVGVIFSYTGGDNVELGKKFDAALAAYHLRTRGVQSDSNKKLDLGDGDVTETTTESLVDTTNSAPIRSKFAGRVDLRGPNPYGAGPRSPFSAPC